MLEAFVHLLKPITAAWYQEFGPTRRPAAVGSPAPCDPADPVEPPPSADPLVVTSATPDVAPVAGGQSAPVAEFSAVQQPAECAATREVAPATPGVAAPVTPAEPLYVRRGSGKGSRYDVAPPDATGTRYRREVVGKRRRFTPVEARR